MRFSCSQCQFCIYYSSLGWYTSLTFSLYNEVFERQWKHYVNAWWVHIPNLRRWSPFGVASHHIASQKANSTMLLNHTKSIAPTFSQSLHHGDLPQGRPISGCFTSTDMWYKQNQHQDFSASMLVSIIHCWSLLCVYRTFSILLPDCGYLSVVTRNSSDIAKYVQGNVILWPVSSRDLPVSHPLRGWSYRYAQLYLFQSSISPLLTQRYN